MSYPWIVPATGFVNQWYFYCMDAGFGPFFLKFCSYFPFNAKLCINGNHWAQAQAARAGLAFTALDNGFAATGDPAALQAICDGLGPEQAGALLRKWLAVLPHPFTAGDRAAGYRYDISILQAEFSLTQVPGKPACGRIFSGQVIHHNLAIGRPGQVGLVFDRRIMRKGPSKRLRRPACCPSIMSRPNTMGSRRSKDRGTCSSSVTLVRRNGSVEMPATTRAWRLRVGPKAVGRVNTNNAADPARSAGRERSPEASLALDAFSDLRRFFSHDVQLAQALGWDEATAAKWRDRLVVRPQRIKVMQVLQLAELAREARAYLEDDTNVGEWLNAPLPNLRGLSPARWVRSRGPIGLRELTRGMVDWMPRPPDRDLEPIDAERARAYLDEAADHDAAAAELRRMLSELD